MSTVSHSSPLCELYLSQSFQVDLKHGKPGRLQTCCQGVLLCKAAPYYLHLLCWICTSFCNLCGRSLRERKMEIQVDVPKWVGSKLKYQRKPLFNFLFVLTYPWPITYEVLLCIVVWITFTYVQMLSSRKDLVDNFFDSVLCNCCYKLYKDLPFCFVLLDNTHRLRIKRLWPTRKSDYWSGLPKQEKDCRNHWPGWWCIHHWLRLHDGVPQE